MLATDDGGARWYSESIARAAGNAEIACELITLAADADEALVAGTVSRLAQDDAVHGILVQTPLPEGVDKGRIAALIPTHKDIDGMNPTSLGRLVAGLDSFAPATAAAVMELIAHHEIELEGREVVIAGRSTVVGKPLAHLCLDQNATVTICHSRTRDLPAITSRADVFIAAVGRPELFTAEYIRERGRSSSTSAPMRRRTEAWSATSTRPPSLGKAGGLSPVPGGVGSVTTAKLLLDVVQAAEA